MGPDAIAQIYASDIISGFDLHKPEKMNVLFNKRGDQGASYFQLIRSMGFELPVANDVYGHFEDLDIHEVIHVRDNVGQPVAGEPVTFVLGTEDLDANDNFYVRLWDNILFPNEVTGTVVLIDVSDPTAPAITVEPHDALDQIPALTDGDELVIHSASWAEGSGQPTGAVSGTWEYSNTAQIIKETIGFTGTEMVNKSWVTVTSMGQQLLGYYMKGQIDIDYRMALKIDGALMWNKQTTNTGIVDSSAEGGGRLAKTTEGLIPYIRRVGNEQACTAGAFDIDEFDEMDRTLTREFAGSYILGLLGINLHQDIENKLVDYLANTNIMFAKQATNEVLFKNNEALSVSVNFTYLTKSERTFLFKRMGVFNNRKLAGAEGYNAPNLGVFMPINAKKDPKSGNMVDSIGTRYRALGKYSRRMEVWQDGAAGEGLKIGQVDKKFTYQRCHVGAHFRGGNQFVLLEAS
jgi:hypothetical protein